MSSTLDDHIRAALDRIRVSLSGQLEADLIASAAEILRAVDEEHRRALLEATEEAAAAVRMEAEQQLSAVRDEFAREKDELARQKEELRRSYTSEIVGLELVLGDVRDELGVARRELGDVHGTRDALQREVDESRQDIDRSRQDQDRLRLALSESNHEIERLRQDLDRSHQESEQVNHQLEQSRQELERSRDAAAAAQRELQESIQRGNSEREGARIESESVARELEILRGKLEQTTRLTSAFRAIDEAGSLGDILERLARVACQETGRTAVFLVNGGKLRGWRALGFPAGQPIEGSDFDGADSGVVGQAVQSGASQQHRNGDVAYLPVFARAGGPRDAVALPVQVGGSVIAVLYADMVRADTTEDPEWLDTIDAMTKHAGRVLEAMTIRQAAALWTPRRGVARSSA